VLQILSGGSEAYSLPLAAVEPGSELDSSLFERLYTPRLRMGTPRVSEGLASESVQRIVRQSYGRFRMCYERGLEKNVHMEGRIEIRFVIDRNGRPAHATNAGSELRDAAVIDCVARAFTALSFPKPEGNPVTVSYPIVFSPG
jgi:hypothetical protein